MKLIKELTHIIEATYAGWMPNEDTRKWLTKKLYGRLNPKQMSFLKAQEDNLNDIYYTMDWEMDDQIANAEDPDDWGGEGFDFDCEETASNADKYKECMAVAKQARVDPSAFLKAMCDSVLEDIPDDWD